jgi:UDP-N-acetylglucosamine:LPS N-acetylglucosamine transferase
MILTGTPVDISPCSSRVKVITAPDTTTMREVITGSSAIIGRSGYTTVMELVSLRRSAVIIPTPGQTEQEYLGEYLHDNHGFVSLKQQDIFKLAGIMKSLDSRNVANLPDSALLLENAIGQLLKKQVKGSGHDACADKET